MCANLKIANLPAGSKRARPGQAGPGPDVNRPCQAGPSNTADKWDRPGRAGPGHKV